MKKKPLIFLNFKKTTGGKALSLIEQLTAGAGYHPACEIALVVDPVDAYAVTRATDWPVYIHDMYTAGPLHRIVTKGFLQENRIRGILTNHPEKPLPDSVLRENRRYVGTFGLQFIVGATNLYEAIAFNARYSPHLVAFENVDLIGKDLSLRDATPTIVREVSGAIPGKVLYGAGI